MSKQVPNSPSLTEGHYGVLEQRTSAKGNKYWKFTGMQIPQGTTKPHYDGSVATEAPMGEGTPAVHPSSQVDIPLWFAPFGIMLKEIYDYVQERKGTPLTQHDVLTGAAKDEPKTETIGDSNISKDELEEIFGGPMADPVDLADRDE